MRPGVVFYQRSSDTLDRFELATLPGRSQESRLTAVAAKRHMLPYMGEQSTSLAWQSETLMNQTLLAIPGSLSRSRITPDGTATRRPVGGSSVARLAGQVRRVAEHVAAGRRQDASDALADMIGRASNPADAGEGLSVQLFAASLERRMGRPTLTRNCTCAISTSRRSLCLVW